jgi:CelD/BcsL family acetyltransferase involved in cellulose biosynthesis
VRYFIANNYDEQFEDHRTGSTLYQYVTEEAFDRGVKVLNFGPESLYYKQQWGAIADGELELYFLFRNRLIGGAFSAAMKAMTNVKAWYRNTRRRPSEPPAGGRVNAS